MASKTYNVLSTDEICVPRLIELIQNGRRKIGENWRERNQLTDGQSKERVSAKSALLKKQSQDCILAHLYLKKKKDKDIISEVYRKK